MSDLSQSAQADPGGGPRRWNAGVVGGVLFLAIAVPCFVTLPWSLARYDRQQTADIEQVLAAPSWTEPMGTDGLGRSVLWRSLLGGAISLGIGLAAAGIAVGIGVTWGMVSGYVGGRTDAAMMRAVDVLYGLPYILLVVMVTLALQPVMAKGFSWVLDESVAGTVADVVTLLLAIGGVSWLTMARVIRGQVLSLKERPFVEAARAAGIGPVWILWRHLVPNMTGPIVVYATLTVPQAILQESLLSFLGIGVQAPLPSWGNLASEGRSSLGSLAKLGGGGGGGGGFSWCW
ncbi:MAG: ABC transporter permease, partial [Planctomycetota bacterium]